MKMNQWKWKQLATVREMKTKTIAAYKLTMTQIWERQTHGYLNFQWLFKAYLSVTSECMFKTVYEKEQKACGKHWGQCLFNR